MSNDSATTSKLAFVSRLPPKPRCSSPPSHVESDHSHSIPPLPPKLYLIILSHLPIGQSITISTLISSSLVSRAFRVAASLPSLWSPHLSHFFPSNPPHWVQLPSTCDTDDQKFLNKLFGRDRKPNLEGKEGFRIRWQLLRFVEGHWKRLIKEGKGKLGSFDVLCALRKMVWRDMAELASSAGEEEWRESLTRNYWVHEVMRSIERRKAARIWRGIDSGDLCGNMLDRLQWGTACFAAFAEGDIGETHHHFHRLFTLIEQGVIDQVPNPFNELDSLPSDAPEFIIHAQLLQCAETIFNSIRQQLAMKHVQPRASNSTEAQHSELDGCFLNLLYHDSHLSLLHYQRSVALYLALEERGAFLSELKPYWETLCAHQPPIADLTLFTNILISVAQGFEEQYLVLQPTEESGVVRTWMVQPGLESGGSESESDSSEDTESSQSSLHREKRRIVEARCLLNVLTGEARLESVINEKEVYLSPCESIRHLALSIHRLSLTSTTPPSGRITRELALYASLLVPSVISKPYTGPTAVIHLTSAALKLAKHVGRYFPFDVSLLEMAVLPLVWGEYARGRIERVVREVKERDGVGERRRWGEKEMKGAVGMLCARRRREEEVGLGVVVGWDLEFSEDTCARLGETESHVVPSILLAGKQQPFYHVIWSNPPFASHLPITYHAEESLQLDLRPGVDFGQEELDELQVVHEVGRWFGACAMKENGRAEEVECRFLPSKELREMYPDDEVWEW